LSIFGISYSFKLDISETTWLSSVEVNWDMDVADISVLLKQNFDLIRSSLTIDGSNI